MSSNPSLRSDRFLPSDPWSPTLSVYIVIVVSMAIWTVSTRLQVRIDGDDALRLVQIRDLLAGQGWFDLTQYRLGFSEGTAIPLFRLVDGPLAGLILLFDLFLDRTRAEVMAMTVWPGLLFGLVVACLYAVCYRLGGPKAAVYGATLASIAVVQTGKFDPGSLNHGNLQMALLMIALVGFVMRRGSGLAAGVGGASAAFSLAIGPEVAAQIAVIFAAYAAVWALRGQAEKRSMVIFALSAVVTSGLVITLSPSLNSLCGASLATILAVLLASSGLAGLALLMSTIPQNARFASIAALSAAVLAFVWSRGASCLPGDGDIFDGIIREKWLDHVMDTRSIAGFDAAGAGVQIGCGVGWLITVWFIRRDVRRDPWTLLCLLLGVSLIMTSYREHTSAVLSMLTILPTAIFAARMIERGNPDGSIWKNVVPIAVLLMSIPAITGAATAMNAAAKEARDSGVHHRVHHPFAKKGACTRAADFSALAKLGEGVVLAPLELAPYILLHTHHRVVPEPFYHVKSEGLAHTQGSDRLAKAGITYVVHCQRGGQIAEDTVVFAEAVTKGVEAKTLQPVRLDKSEPLSIYRVLEP